MEAMRIPAALEVSVETLAKLFGGGFQPRESSVELRLA